MTEAITPIQQAVYNALKGLHNEGPQFTATRYPCTYAYDFVRSHPEVLGEEYVNSRATAAGRIHAYVERTGQNAEEVFVALADGYLDEWHYRVTEEDKAAALAEARRTSWKTLGYDNPPAA